MNEAHSSALSYSFYLSFLRRKLILYSSGTMSNIIYRVILWSLAMTRLIRWARPSTLFFHGIVAIGFLLTLYQQVAPKDFFLFGFATYSPVTFRDSRWGRSSISTFFPCLLRYCQSVNPFMHILAWSAWFDKTLTLHALQILGKLFPILL